MKKKFQYLGKTLSRIESKQLMGGIDELEGPDGGTPCTSDSDCKQKTINCTSGSFQVNGFCRSNGGASTCRWAGCPY